MTPRAKLSRAVKGALRRDSCDQRNIDQSARRLAVPGLLSKILTWSLLPLPRSARVRIFKGGGTMNHWMWPVSLVGILSTGVVCGTDMFFLTVGRPALRLASSSAGTEVMGFLHMFGDARMPIWGVSAILSNFLLAVLSRSEQRLFYFASLLMLILFVISYLRLSKPINQIQTEAAKNGESLNNGRELQASWDRSLIIRVPLFIVSLLAQCLVLLVASA